MSTIEALFDLVKAQQEQIKLLSDTVRSLVETDGILHKRVERLERGRVSTEPNPENYTERKWL